VHKYAEQRGITMAIEMVSLSCPNCGASLQVSSDRESFFCEYCGQKIYVSDSNHQKYTYRKIDDARIREAEAKEAIRIKELELELEKLKSKERNDKAGWKAGLIFHLIFWPFAAFIVWLALSQA